MKCTLNSTTFKKKLKTAIRFLSNKPQIPILSCFLMEAKDGKMSITATDLHMGIQTALPCQIEVEGKAVIPAKILTDLVATFSADITIEADEKNAIITSGKTRSTINTYPDTDFPPFPQKDGEALELSVKEMKKIADFVAFGASSDENRPILTAMLLNFQPQIAVCTDGFRLTALKHSIVAKNVTQVLLPARAFSEVVKTIEDEDQTSITLTLSEGLKQAFFTFSEASIVLRVMDGEFPPYSPILATQFALTASCDADELAHQIKSAMLFSKEKTSIVQLNLSAGELEVVSQSSMYGEYKGSLPSRLSEEKTIEIAFNGHFILEFLSKISGGECVIQLNDSLKPAIFSTPKEKDLQYVAMPFRLSGE